MKWTLRLSILALFIFSLPALQGAGRDIPYFKNLIRIVSRFFPPDLTIWPQVLQAMIETIQIGFLATLFAVFISLPLSLLNANTLVPAPVQRSVALFLSAVRTIPSLVYAVIAVSIVGPYPLAGVIALTFYSIGYLGKFFSDTLNSASKETALLLLRNGAHPVQAFQFGLWPFVKPNILSHAIWMFEYNIRSAAIIGYVGAGGLGLLLHTYQEFGRWDRFSTVLIFIFVVVVTLELIGEQVRKRLK